MKKARNRPRRRSRQLNDTNTSIASEDSSTSSKRSHPTLSQQLIKQMNELVLEFNDNSNQRIKESIDSQSITSDEIEVDKKFFKEIPSERHQLFKCFVEYFEDKRNDYIKFELSIDKCFSEIQKYNSIIAKCQQISGEKSKKYTFKVNTNLNQLID